MTAISYDYSTSRPTSSQTPGQPTLSPLYEYLKRPDTSRPAATPAAKRPREEESLFRCKSCDLSLDSNSALQAHLASHIQCTQCDFTAAPKVVKGHFESAHGRFAGSGFKTVTVAVPGCPVQRFRICVGNQPDDIKQWIEERKRRYPKRLKTVAPVVTVPAKMLEDEPKGLTSLLDGYGSSSASDEDDDVVVVVPSQSIQAAEAAAARPTGNGIDETPKSDVKEKPVCRFFARNRKCKNGLACTFLHSEMTTSTGRPPNTHQPRVKNRTTDTLLGKLLLKDASRERCTTIQLLEYIVRSEFLQKKP
jgi:hypothetical protein